MNDLQKAVRETILCPANKATVSQMADGVGSVESTVYRWGLPADGSGHGMPLKKLISLMFATKDFRILRHLAHRCGFALVKIPFNKIKARGIAEVQGLQKAANAAVNALIDLYDGKSDANAEEIRDQLWSVIEEAAGQSKRIERHHQPSLEIDD